MNIHLEHQQPPDRKRAHGRPILIAITTSALVLIVEIWAAYTTGSLGLLSDAGHALVDVTGLGIAYAALVLASRPASPQATYGYARAEVLAAAVNGLLVMGIATILVVRGVGRLQKPLTELDGATVMWVAGLSMVANIVAAWLLRDKESQNINSRGAFLNVVADALASLGVLVAGALVYFTGNTIWDTLVSFLIAAIILVAAWNLLRGAVDILLERAPAHLKPDTIKAAVESLDDVRNVHDLHVWTLTPGHHSLSMHVSIRQRATERFLEVTQSIEDILERDFGLEHCTIQVEPEGHDDVADHYDPVHGKIIR